jgi:predicted CXXCH cytochrome family protein
VRRTEKEIMRRTVLLMNINIQHVLLLFFFVFALSIAFPERPAYAETPLPGSNIDACFSAKCHADMGQDKFVHGPVATGKCKVCHGENEKHYKKPKRSKFGKIKDNLSKICFSCHDKFKLKKVLHKPLQQGECVACHSPHESPNKFQLLAKGADLCFKCHDKKLNKNKYVHGPAAVGGCILCHDPHSADFGNNLRAKGSELCFLCHTEKKIKFDQAKFQHKPVAENCANCHNPHSAPKKFMMKFDTPELCFTCHKDKKAAIAKAPVKHAAVTEDGTCQNCHDPHMSDIAKNLLLPPMELCMSCHDKKLETPDGTPLENMKQLLTENTDHHGPIKQKDCSGCHNPHGSVNFRILRNSYPPTFYKPYSEENYKLCFSCHEKTVVTNPRTSKLTNFRNGNINLHFKHVNKPEKGRTCRACHETHASNYPKHIRENVTFGMFDLPLNFIKTETGGSCLPGCHQLKKYDRVNEQENLWEDTVQEEEPQEEKK